MHQVRVFMVPAMIGDRQQIIIPLPPVLIHPALAEQGVPVQYRTGLGACDYKRRGMQLWLRKGPKLVPKITQDVQETALQTNPGKIQVMYIGINTIIEADTHAISMAQVALTQ